MVIYESLLGNRLLIRLRGGPSDSGRHSLVLAVRGLHVLFVLLHPPTPSHILPHPPAPAHTLSISTHIPSGSLVRSQCSCSTFMYFRGFRPVQHQMCSSYPWGHPRILCIEARPSNVSRMLDSHSFIASRQNRLPGVKEEWC